MAHKVTKQPWERFPVSVDFSSEMGAGESITAGLSSYAVDSATVDNPIVDENSIAVVDGAKLQVIVYGGASGMVYKVNMRAYINDDKKLEEDFFVFVK